MKRFLWSLCVFVLCLGKIKCYGKETEEIGPLYATGAVLMDADSGRVLYEKNGQEFMANASTTKIMTCILALENAELEDVVTVSSYAASMPDVQLHIREGERYRLQDLLYSLMLESHNDVAVAIAEHVGGSCEEFAGLMNQKAREIGCKNTFFITPNGLDATISEEGEEVKEYHGTTPADLALIMRYCIGQSPMKDVFIKITSTPSHSFSDLENKRSFTCNNHNSLFNLMDGVISGKTGFTSKAGYCYVGAVEQEGEKYIVALLACGWPGNKNYKWKDCKTLIEYGAKSFEPIDLEVLRNERQQEMRVLVEGAKRERMKDTVWVDLISKEADFDTVLLSPRDKITVKIQKTELKAPIKKGQEAGERLYFINDELWKKEKLYCAETIEEMDFLCCLRMIMGKVV